MNEKEWITSLKITLLALAGPLFIASIIILKLIFGVY